MADEVIKETFGPSTKNPCTRLIETVKVNRYRLRDAWLNLFWFDYTLSSFYFRRRAAKEQLALSFAKRSAPKALLPTRSFSPLFIARTHVRGAPTPFRGNCCTLGYHRIWCVTLADIILPGGGGTVDGTSSNLNKIISFFFNIFTQISCKQRSRNPLLQFLLVTTESRSLEKAGSVFQGKHRIEVLLPVWELMSIFALWT